MPVPFATPDQYLELDRRAERHSEYHDGQLYPVELSGLIHGRIGINLTLALEKRLSDTPCQLIGSTVRVRIPHTRRYMYPDTIVACGDLAFEDAHRDTLLNPAVLFEILSPSTEGDDRGEKFRLYRTIPGFEEYVLVSQERVMLERYRRQDEHNWHFESITDPHGTLRLDSIAVEIPVREIYHRVDLIPPD